MDKWDIFNQVIKTAATKKVNKCVVFLPGETEFSTYIKVESLTYDIRDLVVETIKSLFKIDDNQIKDAQNDDFDRPHSSFKGQNPNTSTSEKTQLVIFDDSVEVGSYTGEFYDYYVLRKNSER